MEINIAVVSWVCVWTFLYNAIEGTHNIEPVLIKTAKAISYRTFFLQTKNNF